MMLNQNEKPLEHLVEGYSYTSIFRRVAFVGDSLSSGEFETFDQEGERRGYYDMFPYSWGQFMARKNGFEAYNFSRGGMTAKEYMESFAENSGFWDKEKACQAYVIALGVNDVYNMHMEVGKISDINEDYRKNKPTFLGYYAQIVARYKEICPDAKFFFVTTPKETPSAQDAKAQAIRDALYALADYFENAYVIDLYTYAPVYDEAFHETYFLYGHLSPAGYLLTAQLVDSYIDYIIRHNPMDFKFTGFIGTGIPYKFD